MDVGGTREPWQPPSSAPPLPPPPAADPGQPQRPFPVVAIGATAIAAVALAVAAGGAIRPLGNDDIDRGSALARGLVGAGIGLAAFALAFLVAALRGSLRGAKRYAAVIGALAAICIALGALAGIGTAPTRAVTEEESRDRPQSDGADGVDPEASASLVDADGDGEPDVDSNGEPIVAFDADGDGVFEARLVPCPGTGAGDGGGRPLEIDPSRGVHIDQNCDGTLDALAPLSSTLLDRMPTDDRTFPDNPDREEENEEQRSASNDDENQSDIGRGVGRALVTLLILGLIAALAAGIVWLARNGGIRRSPRIAPPESADDEEDGGPIDSEAVGAAIQSSIETLLGHPDPRLAIRAAYAVLLDALAEAGFPRQPYEAPEEHLTRCLRGLKVHPEPMRQLLHLFAVARFSTHPITEADRAAALSALHASRTQLPHGDQPLPPPTVGAAR